MFLNYECLLCHQIKIEQLVWANSWLTEGFVLKRKYPSCLNIISRAVFFGKKIAINNSPRLKVHTGCVFHGNRNVGKDHILWYQAQKSSDDVIVLFYWCSRNKRAVSHMYREKNRIKLRNFLKAQSYSSGIPSFLPPKFWWKSASPCSERSNLQGHLALWHITMSPL